MKKKLTVVLVCLLSVLMAFAFVACGGNSSSIKLSETTLSLTVGETKELKLLDGETDVSKDAAWSTSDAKVANVTSRGTVSAQGAGSATITAKYKDQDYTCAVTVAAKETVVIEFTDEAGTKIDSISVERDKTVTVKATTSDDSTVTWSVSDTKYATVTPVEGQKNTATIKGVFPTTNAATVYATSGSARASLSLTVTTAAGNDTWYDMVARNEDGTPVDGAGSVGQNKSPLGRWTFWRDQTGWNNGNADMGTAEYVGDNDNSMAGSIHLSYTNGRASTNAGCKAPDTVQITFRSPKTADYTKGLLETGKYYKLTAEITVNFDGIVTINGTETMLHNGSNNITVYFLHADDGVMHGDTDYAIYEFPAFYMAMGSYKENTFVPEADITIDKLQWTGSSAPTALKAPAVSVSGNKVTVTDTQNTEGVANYTVGFFADNAETPVYVKTVAKGESEIDSSRFNNGEYTVKVQANPADGRFLVSPWSAAADAKFLVQNTTVEYDIPLSEEANIPVEESGWWYFNQDGKTGVTAKYKDGDVTFNFGTGTANWYSRQLFYRDVATDAAKTYIFTFKLNSSVEDSITINGKVFALKNGDNNIEVTHVGGKDTLISIQFGVMGATGDDTASSIVEGNFTITDFTMTEKVLAPDEVGEGGENSCEGKWVYWVSPGQDGCTVVADEVKKQENADGTVNITAKFNCTAGSLGYGFQLFHNDAALYPNGTNVKITLSVMMNIDATVSICGKDVTLAAGVAQSLEIARAVNYTGSWEGSTLFAMSVHVENGKSYELTLTNIKFEKTDAPEPDQPTTGFAFGEEKNTKNGWAYWNDQGWVSSTVAVTESTLSSNDDGSFTISVKYNCTAGTEDFGLQIFYNSPAYTVGKTYKLTLTATAKTDCKITVNGTVYELKAETPQQIEVTFTYDYDAAAEGTQFNTSLFDMQAAVKADESYELTLANIKWEETDAPEPNHPKAEDYTLGAEIAPTGTEIAEGGESDAQPDVWTYWFAKSDWGMVNVDVTTHTVENGTITLTYNGGDLDYSLQLFYKTASIDAAKQYFLTLTVETDKDVRVGLHGEVYLLTAGTHTLTAVKEASGTALSIQFHGVTETTTVKVSNVKWQEIQSAQPEIPTGGKEITVTPTEWYGGTFVKISMSTEDFDLVKGADHVLVNGGPQQGHGDGKGFLVDGNVLQVQLPEPYASGKTYTAVWYDAEGNVIARATFTCTQA